MMDRQSIFIGAKCNSWNLEALLANFDDTFATLPMSSSVTMPTRRVCARRVVDFDGFMSRRWGFLSVSQQSMENCNYAT